LAEIACGLPAGTDIALRVLGSQSAASLVSQFRQAIEARV
jgi:hypothetical protein